MSGASGPGTPVPPGTLFDERYEVGAEIGRGGMGVVYLGRDTRLDRRVAIKVLPEAFSTDDEIIARFAREARAMAALDHPNVVPVYDTGRQGHFHYFVMKYLDGRTVADRLDDLRAGKAPPYTLAEVRDIVMQVCRGLGHAHARGMVHRDIKPGNIMVSPDGRATLMDFGIVKAPIGGEALTRTGIVFGTPEYMAPEQAQGETPPSPAADLYSLGAVAYEMIGGDPPFTGSTPFSLVIKHIKEPPPSLIARRSDLDAAFQDVIFRALQKEPADRFPSAEAMHDALGALVPGPRITLPPTAVSGEIIRQAAVAEIPTRGTGEAPAVRASSPPGRARPVAPHPPRRPGPPAVVHADTGGRARPEAGPAVLEDRAGYYTSMVTRDPKLAAESRRRRALLIGGAILLLLAIAIAVFAVVGWGEPHPSGYSPPSDPIIPMPE
ncbi:MAG: serine/threonine protein kinase [Myxococcales bacterium]|nr:serine/threonine protein kinase [Myxococcales bacterium]MCB9550380.1 serine/threonine protein kinase [Myxococcales bacterium]